MITKDRQPEVETLQRALLECAAEKTKALDRLAEIEELVYPTPIGPAAAQRIVLEIAQGFPFPPKGLVGPL